MLSMDWLYFRPKSTLIKNKFQNLKTTKGGGSILIWDMFTRIIIYITKTMFKGLLIATALFLFISYTNVGGSMDMLKQKYYSISGNELKPDEILVDLQEQVDNSMNEMNNVSNMFDKNKSEVNTEE